MGRDYTLNGQRPSVATCTQFLGIVFYSACRVMQGSVNQYYGLSRRVRVYPGCQHYGPFLKTLSGPEYRTAPKIRVPKRIKKGTMQV